MFAAERIAYRQTGAFSKLVLDYIEDAKSLSSFYSARPTVAAIEKAIQEKKEAGINREVLHAVLQDQYTAVPIQQEVVDSIEALTAATTFTICTAHQPNIATGPLYFIYKIVHAVKLARHLQVQLPNYKFVPVYYMGCEDADLDELNHFTVRGKKYQWNTAQKGAVGRMSVDAGLIKLLDELEGQLGVGDFGKEWCELLKESYTTGTRIQDATFKVVHKLFGKYGLVVLISDDARLKSSMLSVFKDDIFNQVPSEIVNATSKRLNKEYKVQAHPRDINLFYLKGDIRQRIVQTGNKYAVHDTDIRFSSDELIVELEHHPERFSPNVILRGLFQETILPNIAFVGGGGELAYWLQLKELFDHYAVPFPIQVLRNSFLVIEKKQKTILEGLNISFEGLFKDEVDILNALVEKEGALPDLSKALKKLEEIYNELKTAALSSDPTLAKHVAALRKKATSNLEELEKKMLRAERRKQHTAQERIKSLKKALFPNGGLQERTENIASFYAKWGPAFIDDLLSESPSLEQEFTVLQEL